MYVIVIKERFAELFLCLLYEQSILNLSNSSMNGLKKCFSDQRFIYSSILSPNRYIGKSITRKAHFSISLEYSPTFHNFWPWGCLTCWVFLTYTVCINMVLFLESNIIIYCTYISIIYSILFIIRLTLSLALLHKLENSSYIACVKKPASSLFPWQAVLLWNLVDDPLLSALPEISWGSSDQASPLFSLTSAR